jgi:hypothetical protein
MSDRRSSKVAATQRDPLASAEFSARSETDWQDRLARLIRTIEGEIVPRLLVSFADSLTAARHAPARDNVAMLARLLLMREDAGAAALARIIRPPGTPRDRAYLRLIVPLARRLNELWERDECDFGQLILGLNRLESVLREVNPGPSPDA